MPTELTQEQVVAYAGRQIRNNGQLRRILRKIHPETERELLYELLRPHLRFKVWPYSAVKS